MAATFVVEDGTGKADANAWITEVEYKAYWENHGDPSSISGLSSAEAEEDIRMGTQYLQAVYGKRWRGRKGSDTQATDWPRYEVYDDDDYYLPSDELPQALKDATAEASYRQRTETDGLIPDIDEPGTIKEYAVKVGPISEKTVYNGGRSQIKKFRVVDLLLKGLLNSGRELQRA